MSETRIRDLAGIITCDFCGIKNVNFASLTQRSEAEAAREQARALTFEKPSRSAYQTIFNVRSQVLCDSIKKCIKRT
jgi:hypothetical protein